MVRITQFATQERILEWRININIVQHNMLWTYMNILESIHTSKILHIIIQNTYVTYNSRNSLKYLTHKIIFSNLSII